MELDLDLLKTFSGSPELPLLEAILAILKLELSCNIAESEADDVTVVVMVAVIFEVLGVVVMAEAPTGKLSKEGPDMVEPTFTPVEEAFD